MGEIKKKKKKQIQNVNWILEIDLQPREILQCTVSSPGGDGINPFLPWLDLVITSS